MQYCVLFFIFLLGSPSLVRSSGSISTSGPSEEEWRQLHQIFGPNFKENSREVMRSWLIQMMTPEQRFHHGISEVRGPFLDCNLCTTAVEAFGVVLDLGLWDALLSALYVVCISIDLTTPDKCSPTMNAFADDILFIYQNVPSTATPADICFTFDSHCGSTNPIYTDWQIFLDGNKPEVTPRPPVPSDAPLTKILQFTDLHLDLNYVEGSNPYCGNFWGCCRDDGTLPGDPEDVAGLFGHPECQLPLNGLEEICAHAQEEHQDVKYIFLTGDYVHSAIWDYSKEENSRHVDQVIKSLKGRFPDTPIFPVLGNHDVDVCNLFPPPHLWSQFDISWLYQMVADEFPGVISQNQMATFLKYGFYSTIPEAGLRILAINSSPCYLLNFWLPFYPGDPGFQLQWMADQLLEAETAGESVFIIGHVSPGHECQSVWSNRFDQIINRFEGIVRGQFYGHSHRDEIILAFDPEPEVERPTSVTFVAPAGTPDYGQYSYRAYLADGARGGDSTWEIVDYSTSTLDVVASNEAGSPVWGQTYGSVKDIYQMASLRPEDYFGLVQRMIGNHTLLNLYQWVVAKGGSGHYAECTVDDLECKASVLCPIVNSDRSDDSHCNRIREQLGISLIN